MTESTGMVVGGDLTIENVFYADCGNSVLQVNGDLKAKLFYDSQCSIEVEGKTEVQHDESVTAAQLLALGIEAEGDDETNDAVRAYFDKYPGRDGDEEEEDDDAGDEDDEEVEDEEDE